MRFKVVNYDGLVLHHDSDSGEVRAEVSPPSRIRPGMSGAAADEPITVHHFGDSALAERATRLRRLIEDGRSTKGDLRDLQVTRALQRVRLRLRWRYGARDAYGPVGDRGTDAYDRWLRHGESPSYALAFAIDRDAHSRGRRSVIAWAPEPTEAAS